MYHVDRYYREVELPSIRPPSLSTFRPRRPYSTLSSSPQIIMTRCPIDVVGPRKALCRRQSIGSSTRSSTVELMTRP